MARPQLRISIVLATYNGAKYLPVQLHSLATQTRLPDELVVSDDASTDDTIGVLERFAATAPFSVRIHRHAKNVGVNGNFEAAFRLADGDILFSCDQDDRWHADKLARVEAVFEADPDVQLVLNNAALVDENLDPLNRTLWEQFKFDERKQDAFDAGDAFRIFTRVMPPFGCTMAVRSALRDQFLPIPSKPSTFDSWIGCLVAVIGSCRLIRHSLQDYRQHASQVTGFDNRSLPRRILALIGRSDSAAVQTELQYNGQLIDGLNGLPASSKRESAIASIKSRRTLASNRLKARQSLLWRAPMVTWCLLNGSYFRSARGFFSAVTDLLAPRKC